jgi:hypothetical protein
MTLENPMTKKECIETPKARLDDMVDSIVDGVCNGGTRTGHLYAFLRCKSGDSRFKGLDLDTVMLPKKLELYEAACRRMRKGSFVGLDSFGMSSVKKRVRWLGDNYLGAYFHGANRAGKSFLTEAVLREFANFGYETCMTSLREIIDEYKSSGFSLSVLEYYKKVTVLGIDDITAEKLSDWEVATVKPIFDARMEKPTFYNGNSSIEGLLPIVGGTITSRMLHVEQIKIENRR